MPNTGLALKISLGGGGQVVLLKIENQEAVEIFVVVDVDVFIGVEGVVFLAAIFVVTEGRAVGRGDLIAMPKGFGIGNADRFVHGGQLIAEVQGVVKHIPAGRYDSLRQAPFVDAGKVEIRLGDLGGINEAGFRFIAVPEI